MALVATGCRLNYAKARRQTVEQFNDIQFIYCAAVNNLKLVHVLTMDMKPVATARYKASKMVKEFSGPACNQGGQIARGPKEATIQLTLVHGKCQHSADAC